MIQKTTVLIADSGTMHRSAMVRLIESTRDLQIAGVATSGLQVVRMAVELRPSVILLDLLLPDMDGLEATRHIMHHQPTPIILISGSTDPHETDVAYKAIRAGALMVLPKPTGMGKTKDERQAFSFLSSIRAMAGVQVMQRTVQTGLLRLRTADIARFKRPQSTVQVQTPPRIVAIGSSTGGPAALAEILQWLPADFALPVVIAQHLDADFMPSLATWLGTLTPLKVTIAERNMPLEKGVVYFSPGGEHLYITHQKLFDIKRDPSILYVPSCDVLLDSVASVYREAAVGVILTGMGTDGAQGLLSMFNAGAFTIAQDEESSVIYGMPHEAAVRGAARLVLPPAEIAQQLVRLSRLKAAPLN